MILLKNYPNFKEKKYAIDGANVCYIELDEKGRPKIGNLQLLMKTLTKMGVKKENMYIFCDANLKYKIDNRHEYTRLINQGIIKETPAGIKADEFILSFCYDHQNALIVSNDLFKEYYPQLPSSNWICEKRITVMKVNNEMLIVPMQNNIRIKRIKIS